MQVSVIIPVYKAETFVSDATHSALKLDEIQEVLLIEDGSPDGSLSVCRELARENSKVTVLRHPGGSNRGAGASRNLGILNASMDYIAFLDADDCFTDIRFQSESEIFSENPACDGVYGAIGVAYVDDVGAQAWEALGLDESSLTTVNRPIPPDKLFDHLTGMDQTGLYKGYFSIDGLTLNRTSLLRAGVLFDESLRLHQDTVFIMQLAYNLSLVSGDIDRPLALRSVHADNRFIRNTNVGESRLLQYHSLLAWSAREWLDKPYQRLFADRFVNFLMATTDRWSAPFGLVRQFATFPALRQNFRAGYVKQALRKLLKGN